MSRRTRYQQGSVQRETRRSGADVWIFRWYETGTDGKNKYRKAIVGTVTTLANEASALKAAQALRIDANQETPQAGTGPSTIAMLVAHYRLKELAGDRNGRKAFSTRSAYECNLENWILPRWGDHMLDQVKSVAVEDWLDGIKRAKGTRAKIRNLMSALFTHAMRYEWTDRNPIKLVRQSAKRERIPDVLELAEIQLLEPIVGNQFSDRFRPALCQRGLCVSVDAQRASCFEGDCFGRQRENIPHDCFPPLAFTIRARLPPTKDPYIRAASPAFALHASILIPCSP